MSLCVNIYKCREREREREGEGGREGGRERERKRETETETETEREREGGREGERVCVSVSEGRTIVSDPGAPSPRQDPAMSLQKLRRPRAHPCPLLRVGFLDCC